MRLEDHIDLGLRTGLQLPLQRPGPAVRIWVAALHRLDRDYGILACAHVLASTLGFSHLAELRHVKWAGRNVNGDEPRSVGRDVKRLLGHIAVPDLAEVKLIG